jgi:hypothetical protein
LIRGNTSGLPIADRFFSIEHGAASGGKNVKNKIGAEQLAA